MSLSTMSRRERTACAVLGMAVLYGLAVLLFFTGREAAWAKARKAYAREAKTYARQCALIGERAAWQRRAEEVSVKMPTAGEDESTQTRWQRILERIAGEHSVSILGEQPKEEEEHGGVW